MQSSPKPVPPGCSRHRRFPTRRVGVVALELLLVSPFVLLLLVIVVEMGLLFINLQQVRAAAFAAAREAATISESRLSDPPGTAGGRLVIEQIQTRVNRTLQSGGLHAADTVLVEYRGPGRRSWRSHRLSASGAPVEAPRWAHWPASNNLGVVRVSVSVPGSHVAPNLLAWLGFDLNELSVKAVSVVPHLNDVDELD